MPPGLKVGLDADYKIAKNPSDEGRFAAPLILTPFDDAWGVAEGCEPTASYDIDNGSLNGNFAVSKARGENIISDQCNVALESMSMGQKEGQR